MSGKGKQLSRAQIVKMMDCARRTSLEMKEAEAEGWRRRTTDPLERAKVALQRAGRVVFSHSLLVPGSTLIVVDRNPVTAGEVIARAEQFGRWGTDAR